MNAITRITSNYDWITLLFFGVICVVWIAKSLYYHRFMEFLQLPFNNKYFSAILKEKNLESSFTLLMLVVQIVSFSLFLWACLQTSIVLPVNEVSSIPFWIILLGVFLFISCKIVLQVLISSVFDIQNYTNEFLYRKLSYLNYSALLILVGGAFSIYNKNLSISALYITFFIGFLVNLVGWLGILKNYQKFILRYLFYFILYLCAFEIAPLLIVGGYLTTK
ncbi:protein of unknown function [Pustulibacterium marinum]|uniref:DUF4271 domain-containing protein n=1 Tax=Pustulibacterium marinum TaxID=1224947 RepID=A0A1I7EY62_9FLAO|nr:DUF4271 domain-containing protein [Pustulibacterium marinum]SFU28825.1 protein of unknown function [Pustulibacterium marinum]